MVFPIVPRCMTWSIFHRCLYQLVRWLVLPSSQVFSSQNSTLLSNLCLCLRWSNHTPQFIEGIHVEWKIVNFTLVVGNWCVCIAVELRKLIQIVPIFLLRSVENMSSIFMDLNSFYFFCIDVTSNVVSFFDNLDFFILFSCLMSKDCTEQTCTYN